MGLWANVFISIFLYRFLRFFINLYAFTCFRSVPPPEYNSLTPNDVTVIIPCLGAEGLPDLKRTVESVLRADPKEIILSTVDVNLKEVQKLVMDMPAYRTGQIRVCSASHPNKRRQMARAIPEVTTPITIFADDDVTWPVTILSWILAPFERDDTGGVVTCQRLRRPETFETLTQRLFYFLGAIYLERRNFDCAATNQMDGGMPCLSGRTVAYRTKILKDDCFTNGFTNETWLWNTSVKADDDNFISRWMVTHRWKTYIQYHHECEVQTTLEDNWKFLAQCLRWARSNWRSNLKSLFVERHVWRRHPYSTYAVFLTTLSPPAFVVDGLLLFCLQRALNDGWLLIYGIDYATAMCAYVAFWFTSKWIKNIGHYSRHPSDIPLIPIAILFGWLHGIIKVRAFFSMNQTSWGSREGADTDDAQRERGATPLKKGPWRTRHLQKMEAITQ